MSTKCSIDTSDILHFDGGFLGEGLTKKMNLANEETTRVLLINVISLVNFRTCSTILLYSDTRKKVRTLFFFKYISINLILICVNILEF